MVVTNNNLKKPKLLVDFTQMNYVNDIVCKYNNSTCHVYIVTRKTFQTCITGNIYFVCYSHVSTTIDPFWDISLDLGPTEADGDNI